MADDRGVNPRNRREGAMVAQLLLELYRTAQDPQAKSLFLDQVRREAAKPPGPFDWLPGVGGSEYEEPIKMLRSIPEGAQLSENDVLALASQAGMIPGGRGYEAFVREMAKIRANQRLQDPEYRATMPGLPEEVGSYEDLELMQQYRQALAPEVRDVTRGAGTQTSVVYPTTEEVSPLGDVKPSYGLLGDLEGAVELTPGGLKIDLGRAGDKVTDAWSREQVEASNRRSAMEGFASIGNQIAEIVLTNKDLSALGNVADITARVRSALKQAGMLNRAANYGGAKTVGQLIDKATDVDFMRRASELSAGVTPLHYLLATSYAAAMGNKDIGRAELQAALQATQRVRSGDPDQIISTLAETIRGLENSNRTYFANYLLESPDLESLAPYVFQGGLLAGPPPQTPSVPSKLRHLPGKEPWTGTADELRDLYREQQQAD